MDAEHKNSSKQYDYSVPFPSLLQIMTRGLISQLRSFQKSLFLNRYRSSISNYRSQRYVLTRSIRSFNFLPFISNPWIKAINREHVTRRFSSQKSPEQHTKQDRIPEDATPHHYHTTTILQRLQELEEAFRVRGHSVLRWGLSAVIVSGFVIYIFREQLKENVADEVADVASRSLGKVNNKIDYCSGGRDGEYGHVFG